MFDAIEALLPAEWRGFYRAVAAPVRWIPEWAEALLRFAWSGDTILEMVVKRSIVLLPCLLIVIAVWSTMASLYTVPFRSGRGAFFATLAASWWDAGRCIWLFWAGMVRVAVALVGWVWGLTRFGARLAANFVVGLFRSPLLLLDWTSRQYFQPGMPWIAFLALILWSGVEATIFTFTLRPMLSELLAGITGFEPNQTAMAPLLWMFLFFLVAGSFACVQVLAEAIEKRRPLEILKMVIVESVVMMTEVMFLYRELVDAITPWFAQQSGGRIQLGIGATIGIACFGWMGVRGMTWFLFGRYGTPALLAVLSRQTIKRDGAAADVPVPVQPDLWRAPVDALKAEIEWFKREAREFFELLSLPVLQLLAAAVNFVVVALQSRPLFSLPFRTLDDMLAATPVVGAGRELKVERGAGSPAPRISGQHVALGGGR